MTDLQKLAQEDFCYFTTTGRVSGKPHEIEIWFALSGSTLYMLSGGGEKADWVKNAQKDPAVQVRIGEQVFPGRARRVRDAEEDGLARRIVFEKYAPRSSDDLQGWSRSSLPLAVDLNVVDGNV